MQCFAETSGRDLVPFFAWYEQAGTPTLSLSTSYDADTKTLGDHPRAGDGPHARPAGEASAADPGLLRPAGRGRTHPARLRARRAGCALSPPDHPGPAAPAGAFAAAWLLGAGEPDQRRAAQGRLCAVGGRPRSVQPLGGGPAAGARPDPGPRRRRGRTRWASNGSPKLEPALADQSADDAFKALLLALPSEARPGGGVRPHQIRPRSTGRAEGAAHPHGRAPGRRRWATFTCGFRTQATSLPTPSRPAARRYATPPWSCWPPIPPRPIWSGRSATTRPPAT